jgi:hypothetical protein
MMKFIFALTVLAISPLQTSATALGDQQRRAATAYERNLLTASDVPDRELRGDALRRVRELSKEQGWLDYFYGDIRDGGPAKRYVYLEFQYDRSGSGVVEIYNLNGSLFLSGEFSQSQVLTWDFD